MNRCIIQAFSVRNGDCLLVSFTDSPNGSPIHLLIDTGYANTYHRTLKPTLKKILALGQKVNLFVMTHVDGDHIGGIKPLLTDFGNEWFDQAWFNYAPRPYALPPDPGESSVRQGIFLRDYLLGHRKVNEQLVVTGNMHILDHATLTILSPDTAQFNEFIEEWLAEEQTKQPSDEPKAVKASDHHEMIRDLINKPYSPDGSPSNRSSIAFLLTLGASKFLFTGDAHAEVLSQSIRSLGYSRDHPLPLQCMKLSHHGSRGNTSEELIELIDCQHYLVSTNAANRHQFPHKEALARVVHAVHNRHPELSIHLYFTYNDRALRDLFSPHERHEYNIVSHFPEDGTHFIKLFY